MSLANFLSNLRRYDENANVIFDREEPVGRATDLVIPHRPWFRRKMRKSLLSQVTAPNDR